MARKYKKSKRYGRRKFRMYKRKRGYKRLVKTIQRIAGVECKYATWTFGPQTYGPGWYPIMVNGLGILGSIVTQGVQSNQMIGNNLYWRKLMVELNISFDGTNAAPLNPQPENLEQWQYRILVIKPYNLTDLLTNYAALSNPRLPGGLQALYTPIDFQTGKVVFDKIYRIGPLVDWAVDQGMAYDSNTPSTRTHKFKFNIFKEYMCDPGSNIWSKDVCLFIFFNQAFSGAGAFKNIAIKGAHTIYYTDS